MSSPDRIGYSGRTFLWPCHTCPLQVACDEHEALRAALKKMQPRPSKASVPCTRIQGLFQPGDVVRFKTVHDEITPHGTDARVATQHQGVVVKWRRRESGQMRVIVATTWGNGQPRVVSLRPNGGVTRTGEKREICPECNWPLGMPHARSSWWCEGPCEDGRDQAKLIEEAVADSEGPWEESLLSGLTEEKVDF